MPPNEPPDVADIKPGEERVTKLVGAGGREMWQIGYRLRLDGQYIAFVRPTLEEARRDMDELKAEREC